MYRRACAISNETYRRRGFSWFLYLIHSVDFIWRFKVCQFWRFFAYSSWPRNIWHIHDWILKTADSLLHLYCLFQTTELPEDVSIISPKYLDSRVKNHAICKLWVSIMPLQVASACGGRAGIWYLVNDKVNHRRDFGSKNILVFFWSWRSIELGSCRRWSSTKKVRRWHEQSFSVADWTSSDEYSHQKATASHNHDH